MNDNGQTVTLYSDEAKQNAIYPRTTFNAVSGINGQTWQQELDAKTNVTDIKDNLTSTDTNKPLSANQGSVLRKKLISNLLKPTLATTTVNGVTCTNNRDGTYTLNGTATSEASFTLIDYTYESGRTYRLVGCPSGGGLSTYRIHIYGGYGYDGGNGATFTATSSATQGIKIIVSSGTTCNNLLFKPMLCTDTNATYNDFISYGDSFAYNNNIENIIGALHCKSFNMSTNTTITITRESQHQNYIAVISAHTGNMGFFVFGNGGFKNLGDAGTLAVSGETFVLTTATYRRATIISDGLINYTLS